MPQCPYCPRHFDNPHMLEKHLQTYCPELHDKPKQTCFEKTGQSCQGFHVHEMKDGKFAVFFDDMPQVTVDTAEDAYRELSDLTGHKHEM
jgi:hypothetical protein